MREGHSPVVHRADYAPPPFWIRRVELVFDLDPVRTIVASRLSIERNPDVPAAALRLHGDELTLLRVLTDGQSVSFRIDDGDLVIDNPPDGSFTLEIRNTCAPEANTRLAGLYTSGGGFFTQCEAEGFRRITFFLDRPDVMAVYTVTLRADRTRFPVLLAIGSLVEQGLLDGGRHFARWHDPHPKPSYLFALVAADLVAREQAVRTRAGREHLLQVWVRRGDLDKTEHALASLVASLAWDEARFGLALDLERFMIVAVSDFNGGAMENKGLNLFNTKYVLASAATATDDDFAGIESVVGHEYFHNWTGNRVTCRDWFQLSLKEGLTVFRDQEFSADMAGTPSARAVKRIADVRYLRQHQFSEDAGPMAHPVRPDAYAAIDNFYTTTVYEKGAEVVRMMHTLVGRDGFARGMALYFQRHDGQAVTCDDFAQAIADANPGTPLAARLDAYKRWYAQSGTPHLTARAQHDAAAHTLRITFSQHCRATPAQAEKAAFVIPVAMGLLGADGGALPLQLQDEIAPAATERVLVVTDAEQEFVFGNVDAPPVMSLLRGFSAPVVLDDGQAADARLHLLRHDSDPFNRWESAQRLMLDAALQAVRGGTPARLPVALVEALRAVLDEPSLDAAFKELLLTLPSEAYIAEQIDRVDPQQVHAVREALLDQLASELRDGWVRTWDTHQVPGAYRPHPVDAGRRALANLALAMLCRDAATRGEPVWPGRAWQRVKDAGNMSECIGALAALVNTHAELAAPALEHFHARFRDEPLGVDKWLALQAAAPARDGRVFAACRALLRHPDFNLANPNRARSLVMTLVQRNPAAFHRADAAGYVFWADQVLALDAINPKQSAGVARALDRWSALAEPYRSAAREALARVAAKPDLSGDVREIVGRALEG